MLQRGVALSAAFYADALPLSGAQAVFVVNRGPKAMDVSFDLSKVSNYTVLS